MQYLKSFSLYEAKQPHPNVAIIQDAMVNTPAGRDLAALARSYKADTTGKLVLEGLRGRTYVAPDPNGGWKHWVVAKSRTYGEGSAPTLEACLRDCWREFVLNSTTFKPEGMKIKEYLNQITPILSSLEGKALNIQDLQWEIRKIIDGTPNANPIRDPKFVWDHPKLQKIFEFIGVELEMYINTRYAGFGYAAYNLMTPNSPLVQMLPYDGTETSKNGLQVTIEAIPEDAYHSEPDSKRGRFKFGGDVSKKDEYKERFIQDLISVLKNQTAWVSGEPLIQALVAAEMLDAGLKGDNANLAEAVASLIHDVSKLILLPEPLRSEVMSKKGYEPDEIEAASAANKYGLI